MTLPKTPEELAARNRARNKLIDVATYMDELWRSPVPLTVAEVNTLQEIRDLLICEFGCTYFLHKTTAYFHEESRDVS